MGDYFEDWMDNILGSVEEVFNAFWNASETAIEVALNESGKSIESSVDWYKDLIIKEYKAAGQTITTEWKDVYKITNNKIKSMKDKAEIKKLEGQLKKADELKKRREQKLETKKSDQLKRLANAREKRLKKLKAQGY